MSGRELTLVGSGASAMHFAQTALDAGHRVTVYDVGTEGDDVYVDFDRSLNTAVARLREALSDSPTRPTFIATVPRKGYRFIATVGAGEQEAVATPPVKPDSSRRSRGLYVVAALVCSALAVAAWWSIPPEQPPADAPLASTRLTYYDGIEAEADFSPDGNQLVFTWNGENQDNFDIYVTAIGGTKPVRLTTTRRWAHSAHSPAEGPAPSGPTLTTSIGSPTNSSMKSR